MKKQTNKELNKIVKQLLDRGELVIGKIRVNDGEGLSNYTTLSACPPQHQEGFRRAVETGTKVYLRDVVDHPVFIAAKYARSVAILE